MKQKILQVKKKHKNDKKQGMWLNKMKKLINNLDIDIDI